MDNADQDFQYLGRKTLLIFVLNGSGPAFYIFLASIVLFFAGASGFIPANFGGYTLYVQLYALVVFLFSIIFFGFAFFVAWLRYINYQYCLGADSLKISRGILNKEEVAIPYRQIQDVNIRRDIAYRIFGLSQLIILTAGQEEKSEGGGESEGMLPALDKTTAEKLQEELLRRADVQKVVATNLK